MPRAAPALAAATAAVLAAGVLAAAARTAPPPAAHERQVSSLPRLTPTPAPHVPSPKANARRPVVRFPNRLSASWGIDVSWPQCGRALPQVQAGFLIVGINGGRPFTSNPCLAAEVAAARGRLPVAAYLNLGAPAGSDPVVYAQRAVVDGLARAARIGLHVPIVWLDVEIANEWADRTTNVAVIRAAIDRLRTAGVRAGVYSSTPMWQQLTGGMPLTVPAWLAITGSEVPSLRHACAVGLGGRPATMVQYVASAPDGSIVDADVLCSPDVAVLRLFGTA